MSTVDQRFVAYSKLLRPFPVRRLHDHLHQTLAGAASIRDAADMLLIDPPVSPEEWTAVLHQIGCQLETLADACDDALPMIERMIEQAPGDHRRALDALVALVRGLQAQAADEAPETALRAA